MRRLLPILCLVAILSALGAPAPAQTLQLDPLPPPPNALASDNAAARLARNVQDEIRALKAKTGADDDDTTAIAARAGLRRLAYDLLQRGATLGGTSDVLSVHGFRLADVRRRIDLYLGAFGEHTATVGDPPRPLSVRERDRVGRLLKRFVETAPKAFAAADLNDALQVDASVAAALAPLCDALAILEGRSVGDAAASGWPRSDELVAAGGLATHAPAHDDAPSADPCDAAARAGAGPLTGAAVEARCAVGDADPHDVFAALALSSSALRAPWLAPREREALDARGAGYVNGGDDAGRALVRAQAETLEAERRLATVERRAKLERPALEAVLRKCLFPEQSSEVALRADPRRLARVVDRVAESVELAVRYRSLEPEDLPKDLRASRRDFEKAYLRAETSTIARLPAMLASDEALGDPEFVGLVRAQREALADIDRLHGARRLVDAVAGARPQAARGVTTQLKTMLKWLLDPARRANGLAAYDALSRQVELFSPLPFEEALRKETAEAVTLAAGEPRKLADTIDVARADWADAWAAGDGSGPAAQAMHRLYRLMRVIDSLAAGASTAGASLPPGADARETAAALSRWGGFYATRGSIAPAMIDLGALTKLAVNAAIDDDAPRLIRELDRLEREAPMARLTARLAADLGPWLARRPGGATGTLAAVRTAPTDDAWARQARLTIAAVCRYARELEDGRRAGRHDLEAALSAHLMRLANRTLDQLGAERTPVPTLIGFDSGDPQRTAPSTGEDGGKRKPAKK